MLIDLASEHNHKTVPVKLVKVFLHRWRFRDEQLKMDDRVRLRRVRSSKIARADLHVLFNLSVFNYFIT